MMPRSSRRQILVSIIVDGLLPFIVYQLAVLRFTERASIFLSALPPVVSNLYSLVRHRRLDVIGVIVLAGIVAGFAVYALGGSPRLLLARDGFITGAIGLVFLVSLALRRSLVFYVARQMVAGGDGAMQAWWDARYAASPSRMGMPVITLVWGVVLVAEAALRFALAFTLSISLFLLVMHVIAVVVYTATITWSFRYGYGIRQREVGGLPPPRTLEQ